MFEGVIFSYCIKKGCIMNFNPFVVVGSIIHLNHILSKLGGGHTPTGDLIDFLAQTEKDSYGDYRLQNVWLESWAGGWGLMSDKFELKYPMTLHTDNNILTVKHGDEVVWSCELDTYTFENGDKGACTKAHLKDFEYTVNYLNRVLKTKKRLEQFVQELTEIVEGFSHLTTSSGT